MKVLKKDNAGNAAGDEEILVNPDSINCVSRSPVGPYYVVTLNDDNVLLIDQTEHAKLIKQIRFV